MRHDRALDILADTFGDLDDSSLDGDVETLGIPGGIHRRRWQDLGQTEDLRKAASLFHRVAKGPVGNDAYAQINAAFTDDLLARIGDHSVVRMTRAAQLRERILSELPAVGDVPPDVAWFNCATRAEALFGERRYAEAALSVMR